MNQEQQQLLQRMIQNMMGVRTEILENEPSQTSFWQEITFLPEYQPAFSAEAMKRIIHKLQKDRGVIYTDSLGICFALFRVDETDFLVGPWVQEMWSDRKKTLLLASLGIPSSYYSSYSIYYHRFPLVDPKAPLHILRASIRTVRPEEPEIHFFTEELKNDPIRDPGSLQEEKEDDQIRIEEQYRLENLFIQAIREGDEEKALKTMEKMRREPSRIASLNSNLITAVASATSLRTLCRKAAEEGGVPLLQIDSISVTYAQKMYAATHGVEIRSILVQMIGDFTRIVRETQSIGKTVPVRKTANRLRMFLNQNFTLEELAGEAGITPNYLTQRFKEETGMTVFEYQARLRIQKACQLLDETSLPIQNIAAYVGYLDNNYFVKVFKKQKKITPSEYRKGKSPTSS